MVQLYAGLSIRIENIIYVRGLIWKSNVFEKRINDVNDLCIFIPTILYLNYDMANTTARSGRIINK